MLLDSDDKFKEYAGDCQIVTHEILLDFGFVMKLHDLDNNSYITFTDKYKNVLCEYCREHNPALVQPYDHCYSGTISMVDSQANFCIYTVGQLKTYIQMLTRYRVLRQYINKEEKEITDILFNSRLQ